MQTIKNESKQERFKRVMHPAYLIYVLGVEWCEKHKLVEWSNVDVEYKFTVGEQSLILRNLCFPRDEFLQVYGKDGGAADEEDRVLPEIDDTEKETLINYWQVLLDWTENVSQAILTFETSEVVESSFFPDISSTTASNDDFFSSSYKRTKNSLELFKRKDETISFFQILFDFEEKSFYLSSADDTKRVFLPCQVFYRVIERKEKILSEFFLNGSTTGSVVNVVAIDPKKRNSPESMEHQKQEKKEGEFFKKPNPISK